MKSKVFILSILIFIIGLTNLVLANVPSPKVIRKQLLVALEDKKLTDSLYNILSAEQNKSALNICYLGVVQALKAKHAWNPYYKVKYLNDAEKTLQTAVSHDPENMEIRFMRFSIEHNVPGFLGYTKHLVADREAMIKLLDKKHYTTADHEVVVTIVKFLIDSKRCTPQENDKLHKHLAALQ
jgi:hypothetical protein